MWINPATLSCMHDSHSKTGQVQGGYGHDQDQALKYFGRRELAGVDLIVARFFIAKARFNVEAQAILVQGSGISELVTHHKPGVVWLVEEAGKSQVHWSYSCS
jgi:hypothetical protein